MRAGFEEYFDLSDEDFKELWESATFVFDTNALLSLFRDKKATSDELIKIMTDLTGRVWIPHQVASEFHKNRLGVIIQNGRIYSPIRSAIEVARKSAIEAVGKINQEFKHHPVMSGAEAISYIEKKFDDFINDINKKEKDSPSRDYYKGVFDKLVSILEGVTGSPYDPERMREILSEGAARCLKKTPPGYIDYEEKKGEEDVRKLGDFIIWRQIIDYSTENKKDIIFITDDVKEDWWRRVKGEMNGPRVERIREFKSITGNGFYMYTRHSFLKRASEYLKLNVSAKTIEDVKIDYVGLQKSITVAAAEALSKRVASMFSETFKTLHAEDGLINNSADKDISKNKALLFRAKTAKRINELKSKIEFYTMEEGEIMKELLSSGESMTEAYSSRMNERLNNIREMKESLYINLMELNEQDEELKKSIRDFL